MERIREVMTVFTTLVWLHGGSGGRYDETSASKEAPPLPDTTLRPCGTYDGRPVACPPLQPGFSFEDYETKYVAGHTR